MPDDPNDIRIETAPPRKASRPFSTFKSIAIAVVVIGLAIALLLPSVRSAREPARRNQCMSQLKRIGYAIHAYEKAMGTLPPAYTVDSQGNRLHSWRTLILPFLESPSLFESIDLSKPWDDPANAAARNAIDNVYSCPSADLENGMTTYLGVTGPQCIFTGADPRPLSSVRDLFPETLMVVDVPADQAVHWMSPHDVDAETFVDLIPNAKAHHGVLVAMFVDGHPSAIPTDVDPQTLRGMLTIDGGESLDDDEE